MQQSGHSFKGKRVILGLSGGVDSAVAAILMKRQGADVQALHMTNWEDDDGYCTAADDLQDARNVCEQLGITLHHVNFAREYRQRVFSNFLDEYRAGRTPNPDVLCNREIKFGEFLKYAKRLDGDLIATGHYARRVDIDGRAALFKARDRSKDQSYFLHAVNSDALGATVFPLGELLKSEVREIARDSNLAVHDKKDSTGICFIGERPFRKFLEAFLPANPGPIRTAEGLEIGAHQGLMYYTLGQRQGLGIGGRQDATDGPWYVVAKDIAENALVVAQGEHPLRYSMVLQAIQPSWIDSMPAELATGQRYDCSAKIRYRQRDQPCSIAIAGDSSISVTFENRQIAVSPGQFVVFYSGERCLGGAVIDRTVSLEDTMRKTG
ncbi:MAG: tRNA 2-thiouridine(34) synthase MnmA [Proteobacteria bacterium]|nr:tRNA 2-thiouridine(34) synthase MnmA [Pseudomonadota bacterium]MDA0993465.1 tRNA 2-thiouridine(34) synthase MnmA [Pseudomonadota bacterium]